MRTIAILCAAVLLLTGCSGSSDDAAPTREPTSTSSSDQAARTKQAQDELARQVAEEADGRRVDIVIKDGKVTPQGGRVEVKTGQQITLRITSDADEEIHVHSEPENSYEVAAGGSITGSFTLDTPGQVAVEAHHLDVTIVQLVVRP